MPEPPGTPTGSRLVWSMAMPAYGAGRVATARRWFGWFEDQGLLGRHPQVAVLGAWLQALVGEPVAAERWADAAEHGPVAGTLPDGSTSRSYLALLRALLCRHGIDRMRADTQAALDELDPASQWRPTAQLLEGIGYLLAGRGDRADPILAHATEVATEAGALPAAAIALAERSLVAMDHQDWRQAATLAEQAQGWFRRGSWTAVSPAPWSMPWRPGWPCTRATSNVPSTSWRGPRGCGRCSPMPCRISPSRPCWSWAGRVWLWTASPVPGWVRQAREILRRRPDLGILPKEIEELWSKLDLSRGGTGGASSLTTAELRVLPLLPTHLTYTEIGQRLYVSQHTVKSQAMSVYRKLGVSSRSQAVQRLQQLGLGG